MTKKKQLIIAAVGVAVLAAICAIFIIVFNAGKDEPEKGAKEITIEIVAKDSEFSEKYDTDEEYLGDLLENEKLIGFDTTEYGRFITSANGIEADADAQEWWALYVNGEMAVTGVDETVIEDGSVYRLELTVGW